MVNCYRVKIDDSNVLFRKTLAQARAAVRDEPAPFRGAIEVDLVRAKNDQDGTIAMLNAIAAGDASTMGDIELQVLRSWRGKARGGLRPVEAQ